MPKMKTHKGTKKRFRLTAKGKVKHRSAGTSHLATRMSQKRKRNLRGTTVGSKVEPIGSARPCAGTAIKGWRNSRIFIKRDGQDNASCVKEGPGSRKHWGSRS